MSLAIAQVSQSYDTVLARDRMVNTLWFDVDTVSIVSPSDWDQLAEDLANIYVGTLLTNCETTVKFYKADDAVPRPVVGQFTLNGGASPSYGCPRESCLVLSYYADRNLPKKRGRIYVPVPAGSLGQHGVRPSDSQIAAVLSLAQQFADLGGLNVDWVMHSPTDQNHYNVTAAWVDDEWDTMRSRGLRATKRSTAVTGP